MFRVKYKNLVPQILCALSLLLLSVAFAVPLASRVAADPLASCGTGATPIPPQNGDPSYCSCPSPEVLITATNDCASDCPSGTVPVAQYNQTNCNTPSDVNPGAVNKNPTNSPYYCGDKDKNPVYISIDIGCSHQGNPILDMLFAVIRFLSYGVGLVIIVSLIIAGIQYSTSAGDPKGSAAARKRIGSTLQALLIFIFAYAILDYLIPNQFLHP